MLQKLLKTLFCPNTKNNLGRWAVYTKNDNEFIGWCGLKHLPDPGIIDLGYRFIKIFWGKGFATEAAKHTLDYGFKNLHIDIITGRAHIENVASQKVLEKIGMKYIRDELVDNCPVKTYIATLQEFVNP